MGGVPRRGRDRHRSVGAGGTPPPGPRTVQVRRDPARPERRRPHADPGGGPCSPVRPSAADSRRTSGGRGVGPDRARPGCCRRRRPDHHAARQHVRSPTANDKHPRLPWPPTRCGARAQRRSRASARAPRPRRRHPRRPPTSRAMRRGPARPSAETYGQKRCRTRRSETDRRDRADHVDRHLSVGSAPGPRRCRAGVPRRQRPRRAARYRRGPERPSPFARGGTAGPRRTGPRPRRRDSGRSRLTSLRRGPTSSYGVDGHIGVRAVPGIGGRWSVGGGTVRA